MIQKLDSPMVSIDAIDHLPKCITLSEEERVSLRATKTTGTGNLSSKLELKISARVRLINNIDISDRLINGQIGVVKYIKSVAGKLTKIYVSFDDNPAELCHMMICQEDISKFQLKEPKLHSVLEKISFTIKRTQFPVTLLYACTIHKVQGLSLQQVVVLNYIG